MAGLWLVAARGLQVMQFLTGRHSQENWRRWSDDRSDVALGCIAAMATRTWGWATITEFACDLDGSPVARI